VSTKSLAYNKVKVCTVMSWEGIASTFQDDGYAICVMSTKRSDQLSSSEARVSSNILKIFYPNTVRIFLI